MDTELYRNMARLAVRRPRTIPDLMRAAWAFRAREWHRRPPFLPLPPPAYMRWRMETAYGAADAAPTDDELERFLAWASWMRREAARRLDD